MLNTSILGNEVNTGIDLGQGRTGLLASNRGMHNHDLMASASGSLAFEPLSIALLLLATGLLGSFTHCAGMCGPFVLTQIDQQLGRMESRGFGGWQRLQGAALLPYHLGRLTTYTGLGALSAGAGSLLVDTTGWRWLLAGFLVMAATLFAAQAAGIAMRGPASLPPALNGLVRVLTRKPFGFRGYALGLALGFLPCGLLYGALATSAAAGSAVSGALAMSAFGLGTVPALVAIGWGGILLGLRRRRMLQSFARPMQAASALALILLAVRALH